MKTRIVIIGAGDLGLQLYTHIIKNNNVIILGWLDDTLESGSVFNDLEVIGGLKDIEKFDNSVEFLIAIGYKNLKFKNELINKIKLSRKKLHTFIHNTAFVDSTAIIEEGVIIYPGCIIDMNVKLKSGVLLNNGVIVSHDSTINETVFVGPGVTICGKVSIGKCCFIGSGTIIKDNIAIEDNVIVGSGSNIYKNINKKGTYIQDSKNIKLNK